LIDVFATFPFDIFFDTIAVNNQLLKSFKIARIIKLFRVIKFTKLYSFMNMNKLIKNEMGLIVYQIYKRNRGYLDLFASLFYIFIAGHFFTVIY